jgi:hypothetical protein
MPKKVTIYHKEAGAAELYTIDAREALNRHPGEWSASEWPAAKAKPKSGEVSAVSALETV